MVVVVLVLFGDERVNAHLQEAVGAGHHHVAASGADEGSLARLAGRVLGGGIVGKRNGDHLRLGVILGDHGAILWRAEPEWFPAGRSRRRSSEDRAYNAR